MNYVLGAAAQNASNARLHAGPFVHAAATRSGEHDDRAQFLAGVDIFLAGISALRNRAL